MPLRKQMTTKTSSVSLDVSLHLVVPLPGRDASVTEVTNDNLECCLQKLKRGSQFSYKKVLTKGPADASYRKGIYNNRYLHVCLSYSEYNSIFFGSHAVFDHEKDFHAVYEETASVVQWFTLDLYLRLAPSELERISVDYHFNREDLQQMLSAWLKTGEATWLSLVCELSKMGKSDLASKIARKKGVCVCVCVCLVCTIMRACMRKPPDIIYCYI